jgi:hypothetical protein
MLFTSERRGTRFAFVFLGGKDKLIIYLYRDIIIFLLYREMKISTWFSSRSRKVANDSKVIPEQRQQELFSRTKVHPSNSARRKSHIAVDNIPTVQETKLRESETRGLIELLSNIESRKSNQSRNSNQLRKSNQSRNSGFEISFNDIDDVSRIDRENFEILLSGDNPSSLILKPTNPITDTNYIYRLLKKIEQMDALEELEFSNFVIDVSDFLKSSGGIPFEVLFSIILTKLTKLKRITFDDNVFDDAVKRYEYYDFQNKYFGKDGIHRDDLERISLIVEWMIKNPEQNIDGFDFNAYNAYREYLSSNTFNGYIRQKQKNEGTQLPHNYDERHPILKARAESSKASHTAFSNDIKFESFLVFLQDKEAVEKWLKWLILNNDTIINVKYNIIERLRIVIEYFKYNIYVITFLFKNPELQNIIISEFDKIWGKYQPHPNEHYTGIIKDIIGDKLVKSRGGRKAPKKPKPPKVSLKAPKKPKPSKVALKAPKVARKTQTNKK